jgi:hypothetical protein
MTEVDNEINLDALKVLKKVFEVQTFHSIIARPDPPKHIPVGPLKAERFFKYSPNMTASALLDPAGSR